MTAVTRTLRAPEAARGDESAPAPAGTRRETAHPRSRAQGAPRCSQSVDLLLIAPDIQEEVLFLEPPVGSQHLHEHDLRGFAALTWHDQRKRWSELLASNSPTLT
jgi:hypothetical protein